MKVYIAGKMRGRPGYNYPMFKDAARELRSKGHQVISPVELDLAFGENVNEDFICDAAFLSRTLLRITAALMEVEAIVVLHDWRGSVGVKMELAIGEFLGLPVYFYHHGGDLYRYQGESLVV